VIQGIFTDVQQGDGVPGPGAHGRFIVGTLRGGTFLGGPDVEFISVETGDFLVQGGQDPRSMENARGFQKQAKSQQNVCEGSREKDDGERRSEETPHHGSDNGGAERPEQSSFEQLLDTVRDTKDIFVVVFQSNGCDACDEKHARHDTKLPPDHKSRKVVVTSALFEEELACLLGEVAVTTLALHELGDGEISDLRSLEKTNNKQKDQEDDDRDARRDKVPHGGVSVKEGVEGGGEGKDKEAHRHGGTSVEEDVLQNRTGRFIGFNCRSGTPSSE